MLRKEMPIVTTACDAVVCAHGRNRSSHTDPTTNRGHEHLPGRRVEQLLSSKMIRSSTTFSFTAVNMYRKAILLLFGSLVHADTAVTAGSAAPDPSTSDEYGALCWEPRGIV